MRTPPKTTCEGTIRFERTSGGELAIRIGWNPSSLSRSDRTWIARELSNAAKFVRQNKFENNGEMVEYPLPQVRTK